MFGTKPKSVKPKVIWKPCKGSQELALSCPADEILYEGTRGPGKTDTQLMKFRRYVGQGFGPFWRGVIFDRGYKNLDDLVSKSQRWFPQFGDHAKFYGAKADYKWVWPTGEELLFRRIRRLQDYWDYHGQEFPFIGWNELSKFPSPDLYDAMLSCNRSSFLPTPECPREIPLLVLSTTNPFGSGHNWIKRQWIDPVPPGVIMKTTVNVYNPRTGVREDIVKTRAHIFGSYKENPYLSPAYIASLEKITDKNKRRAWLYGDWDIVAGGALDDVWGDWNLLPRFRVPKTWRINRSMDWGSSHPFSIGWWAETDGSEVVLPGGKKWTPVAGSLIRIFELYGTEKIGTNKGIRMGPLELSKQIRKWDNHLQSLHWVSSSILAGPADNQIRDVRDGETKTIADVMETQGVYWNPSDKAKGSRKMGLELIRQRLQNARTGEGPGLYFMSNCKAAIETLPTLPRDEDDMDDVDTESEDHVYDDCRYEVLSSNYRNVGSFDCHFPGIGD